MNENLTISQLVNEKRLLDKELNELIMEFKKETGLNFNGINTIETDISCHPYKIVSITTDWDLDNFNI